MYSRTIIRVLKAGIQALLAEPERVESFFIDECGFSLEEAENVRALFKEKPPEVFFQHPRTDIPFPMYAVILKDETETDPQYLNKGSGWNSGRPEGAVVPPTLGSMRNPNISPATRVKMSLWDHDYEIWAGAENPDVCLYIYELAKVIMLQERERFISTGALDTFFSGADMGPSEEYKPDYVFLRSLNVTVRRELRVLGQKGFIIQDVRGIHVDDPGAPDDGLLRNVTPVIGSIDGC